MNTGSIRWSSSTENEECKKQGGLAHLLTYGLFQKSFEHGTASEQAEAARALIAACGDVIELWDADDKQVMVLAAAMEGSPIRVVDIFGSLGSESLAKMKQVAEANNLTVHNARPDYFEAY